MIAKQPTSQPRRVACRPSSLAWATALQLCASAAQAQSTDPTTDPIPAYDSADPTKSFLVNLNFASRFEVTLDSVQVVRQRPAGKASQPPLLNVQLRGLDGSMLSEFAAWHPQWAFTKKADGREQRLIVANRPAKIVSKFDARAAQLNVFDVAANNTMVATVDLLPTSHAFCRANSADPDCAELANRAPTCSAGGPYIGECSAAQTPVQLNGSLSADPDSDLLQLTWTGSFPGSPVNGVNPTVNYTGVGNYPVSLAVNDGKATTTCGVSVSVLDRQPPSVVAAPITTSRCLAEPVTVQLVASASDVCVGSTTSLVGAVTSVAGKALSTPMAVPANKQVVLPPGVSTVVWTATDSSGNTSVPVTQTVTINVAETAAACCPSGTTVVNGSSLPDLILRLGSSAYCVFGNGGVDTVSTSGGADLLFGGDGGDSLSTGLSSGDKVSGGPGNDWIHAELASGVTVFGGAGDDIIDQGSNGIVHGNAGNDLIDGSVGSDVIYPGPGRDTVHAGLGDDTVIIRHACELDSGELLDGELGTDTLITPVPVTELQARGVIVLGFQNIIVQTNEEHLSECR